MNKREIEKTLEKLSNDFIKKVTDYCEEHEMKVKFESLSFFTHAQTRNEVKAVGGLPVLLSCKKNKDGQVICS